MAQLSAFSPLGRSLRDARKGLLLTQCELARQCSLSVNTIRNIERGRGWLSTLATITQRLDYELRGRSLQQGEIGNALQILRKRHGISRRKLARMLSVSRTTLAALEAGQAGRFETLEAVGQALGAGLYFAALERSRSFYETTGNSSSFHGWHTPRELLDQLARALGSFDLDPCADPASHVQAHVKINAADDGLSLPWRGLVFCNPPYGSALKTWVAKCHSEAASGRACVVALIPARTDTKWWHNDIAGKADTFLLKGRLRFGDGENSAPFPSALAIWGADAPQIAAMKEQFPDAWHVPAG